jgi:hypothetical protein
MTTPQVMQNQHQDTGEMMRLRVVNPPNMKFDIHGNAIGGSIYNGYIGQRVYLGQETDIPLYRPFRDEDGHHLRNADGSLRYKKQSVPKWAELVKIVPPPRGWEPEEAKPATPVAPLAKSAGGAKAKATKSFGRSTARAADTSIGE